LLGSVWFWILLLLAFGATLIYKATKHYPGVGAK